MTRIIRRLSLYACIWCIASTCQAVDFQREVLPLLSDRCFACHGPDEHARQAELRLDDRTAAIDYGAIVPGDAAASLLVDRIFATDDIVMPPPDAKQKLSQEEREVLKAWVAEGAVYQQHWAFVPPQKVAPPNVANSQWPSSTIDQFVMARLEAEGIGPREAADRYTLARRLYLDLTGLPPSADEVEAFVGDADPKAYEKLVDRLLASPHFGERMALEWLDAVRYADTNGYSIDGGRHMWLWRDWVIDAFNRNLPYDDFLVEQLAGDLLDHPTDAQLIATGMQRNNMVTHEGGTIPAENLTNYNADRVKTLGEAVLGMTLGCAQCHDHKYDPIRQRDYYRLFAFFNTIGDKGLDGNAGVNPRPFFEAKTVLQTGEEQNLTAMIERLEHQLAHPDSEAVDAWEEEQRRMLATRGKQLEIHPTKALRISTPNAGSGFTIEDERDVHLSAEISGAAFDVLLRLSALDEPVTGVRVRFVPGDDVEGCLGHGKLQNRSADKTFVLSALSISADRAPGDQVNLHRLIGSRQVTASSWQDGYRPEQVLDPRRHNGWSPGVSHDAAARLTYTFEEPIDSVVTPYLTVQLNFGMGGNLVAKRMQIDVITGIDDDSYLPPEVIGALSEPKIQRTDAQREAIATYYSAHATASEPLRIELANAKERLDVVTGTHATMIMEEADEPRVTHILNRGDYSQPGETVAPGTPDVLLAMDEEAPRNRLGLARWLVDPEHSLTSRVEVNRIWKQFFGAGLVRTLSDFGMQGAYPTHPELLDWLAVDFVEHEWDVKRLVRNIVTSSTYCQSAVASVALQEIDPRNELLARGPRFRLPAEFIRDMALKASGLMVDRLGGPSVNPYAPGDLWREVSHYGSTPATAQAFVQDHGEKLYRRSLYTYWKRTVPPPNLAAFDAPSRETCTVDRPTTNTPLQALVLLNDTQFVEAARAFAERVIASSDDDRERLRWAFYETVSRPPDSHEIVVLAQALKRERAFYENQPVAATELLAVGESPRNEQIYACEHAAWTQVATLLLNLSEAITRN